MKECKCIKHNNGGEDVLIVNGCPKHDPFYHLNATPELVSTPNNDIEGWEERLQVEIIEDYILTAENRYRERKEYSKSYMERMRAHLEKLKDFIHSELAKAEQRGAEKERERIVHGIKNWKKQKEQNKLSL